MNSIFKKEVLILLATFGVFLISPKIDAESAEKMKQSEEAVRQNMIALTRQLGTTCNVCHNPDNFKDATKPNFKIAKDHIRLTQLLIDSGMDGKNGNPKADCFMCHRGTLKPDYKEHIDPMVKDELHKNEKKSGSEEH